MQDILWERETSRPTQPEFEDWRLLTDTDSIMWPIQAVFHDDEFEVWKCKVRENKGRWVQFLSGIPEPEPTPAPIPAPEPDPTPRPIPTSGCLQEVKNILVYPLAVMTVAIPALLIGNSDVDLSGLPDWLGFILMLVLFVVSIVGWSKLLGFKDDGEFHDDLSGMDFSDSGEE